MPNIKTSNWKMRSKVWLELNGQPVMGEGRMAMLRAIERQGSILHASHQTGISYRRMRGALQEMEAALGQPLVKIHRGGGHGGGAELTPAAYELLDYFENLTQDLQQSADDRFKRLTGFLPAITITNAEVK